MLKQALACVQSHQSPLCSHACAKWAYIWHIPSVNAQTSLSVCAVFQEPLLLSHMYKMGVYMAILSVNAQTRLGMLAVLPEPSLLSHIHKMGVYGFFYQSMLKQALACVQPHQSLALTHAQKGRTYGIFFQSMLRRALAWVQSCQSLHCSRTCTKWAYIWQIYSVNAQTRLSIHAVLPEPSLLSHMYKMGVHMANLFSQCSDET